MPIGVLTLHLHLDWSTSLKDKRRAIRPLIQRLQREFNISVAEMDYLDDPRQALIACAHISNDANHTHRTLTKVARWVETHWGDGYIADERIELL
ncbi:MAG: DUF503 domain-containing protein [Chloroflexi bacterium]|nr:DUF503 domain-containing protein [Chloroflexota bacterium]